MNKYIISGVLVLSFAACTGSNNDEYKLDPELVEKAKAIKEQTAETKLIDSDSDSESVDQNLNKVESQETSPKWVAEQVFAAARNGEFFILSELCDPSGEVDQSAQRLCSVAFAAQSAQEDFMNYFKLGKTVGDVVLTGNQAAIQITFGYEGITEATLKMVKKEGKWYLSSF